MEKSVKILVESYKSLWEGLSKEEINDINFYELMENDLINEVEYNAFYTIKDFYNNFTNGVGTQDLFNGIIIETILNDYL